MKKLLFLFDYFVLRKFCFIKIMNVSSGSVKFLLLGIIVFSFLIAFIQFQSNDQLKNVINAKSSLIISDSDCKKIGI
jgi:hypothetical protein